MPRALPDFDEFSDLLEEMVEEIPERFLTGVDGIYAVEQAQADEKTPGVFLLGQYHQRADGRFVQLFYGSFVEMGWRSRKKFLAEMRETLLHELRHHWEEAAGLPDLRREDEEWLAHWRAHGAKRRQRGHRRGRLAVWVETLAAPLGFLAMLLAVIGLVAYLVGN